MIDDQVANPGAVSLTTNNKYETHSFLAIKTTVPAGNHSIHVQWKVSGGTVM
jgi:hypothetical protein